jgi:rubrerythrin
MDLEIAMDLEVMLDKCRREQWSVGDLDWSGRPREMSRDDEIAIVQYFTDMAGIERLAGALFVEQGRRAQDPSLRAIFQTFVDDEVRHAQAAQMLADYYDVHHYCVYQQSAALRRFTPYFVDAIRQLTPEIANAYITAGELILDVALLRSIDDHVHDPMSARAMALINRDESRHIAIDFRMVEYYASDEYMQTLRAAPRSDPMARARAAWALAGLIWYGAPFFKDVFFEPMRVVDPSGQRLKQAFKRIQILSVKPGVQEHPFTRFMTLLQNVYNDRPIMRLVFGRAIERIVGVSPELIARLYSDEELARARAMSFDELADEALRAKYAD